MFVGYLKPIDKNSFLFQANDEILKDLVSEFGGEYIIFREDYIVDDEIAKNLNLESGFTIIAGTYKLVKNTNTSFYEITFKQ